MKFLNVLILVFFSFFTQKSFSKKSSPAWEPIVQASQLIVSATATKNCSYCGVNKPAEFLVIHAFKGADLKKGDRIFVNAQNLSFTKKEAYLLFLQKKEGKYKWVAGNSPRPKANTRNIKRLQKILNTQTSSL